MFLDQLLKISKRKERKEKGAIKDHVGVSAIKAITWRLVGTLDTILISFLLTKNVSIAISIGGIEVFSKILLYFCHERAWAWIMKK